MSRPERTTATAAEVAEALGCSPWSVYQAVKRGEIPNVGVGKNVRIPRSWLNARIHSSDAAGISDMRSGDVLIPIPVDLLDRLAVPVGRAADLTDRPDDRQLAAFIELQAAHAAHARVTAASAEAIGAPPS